MLEEDTTVLRRTHRQGDACLTRVGAQRRRDAAQVLARYSTMALAGLTHFEHLLLWDGGRLRWRRHDELPRVRGGASPIPAELYTELLRSVPTQWGEAMDQASWAAAERPHAGQPTVLADVLALSTTTGARAAWVRLADGRVCQRKGGRLQSPLYGVSPARRLYPVEGDPPEDAGAQGQVEVVVWSEHRLAHSNAEREGAEEIESQGNAPDLLLGGDVLSGAARPEQLWVTYATTDRQRRPVPFSSADVYHLYQLQLSWAWGGAHRTLAPGGMWCDVLAHPTLPENRVRGLVYGGLADGALRRGPREAAYRVLQDDMRMWRRDGCGVGCTQQACEAGCISKLCILCAHMHGACGGVGAGVGSVPASSTRHTALECPRAAALLDALARAYAGAVGWHVAVDRTMQSLLSEVGAAMLTGYQGGSSKGAEPLRALAAETAAMLTGRWRREDWSGSLAFGVADMYARVVENLQVVARCARQQAARREAWQVRWFGPRHTEGGKLTPLQEWEAAWVKSGLATLAPGGGVRLRLPPTMAGVAGADAPTLADAGRISVCPWLDASGGDVTVRIHLGVGMPIASGRPHAGHVGGLSPGAPVLVGAAAAPADTQRANRAAVGERRRQRAAHAPPTGGDEPDGALRLYTDGSYEREGDRAGFGMAVVASHAEGAALMSQHCGPVVTDQTAAPWLGAVRPSNNTAELTGLGEALRYVLGMAVLPPRITVISDSEYAVDATLGITRPRKNRALVARIIAL